MTEIKSDHLKLTFVIDLYADHIEKTLAGKAGQEALRRIGIFKNFAEENYSSASVSGLTKDMISHFKQWLFNARNEKGYYHSPSVIKLIAQRARYFCLWLIETSGFKKDPFSGTNFDRYEKEAERHSNLRRSRLIDERCGRVEDEEILRRYLEHANSTFTSKFNDRFIKKVVVYLKTYSLLQISEADIKNLVESWCGTELYPSIPIAVHTLNQRYYALRNFFRWLWQEGYRKDNPVYKWTEKTHMEIVKAKQAELAEARKKKKPQYSIKDILTAYKRYLNRTYANFCDIETHYISLKVYIRFIAGKDKTLYSADRELISGFKEYLFNHEFQPCRFYTPYFQAERVRAVKRFYDWFTNEGYTENHPLSDYQISKYRKEISERWRVRQEQGKGSRPHAAYIPEAFREMYMGVFSYEKTLNLADGTLRSHEKGFRVFFIWLEKAGIQDIKEVDEAVLNDYQVYLNEYRHDGRPVSLHTRIVHLVAVKRLFHYLARFKYMPRDPSACISFPKFHTGLPTAGMKHREVMKLIDMPDIVTDKGIRDRCIIELLYTSGMRRNELRNIKVQDINLTEGYVRINMPKGGMLFQRVVPIGKSACEWISKYITEVRSRIRTTSEYLFLNRYARQMSGEMVYNVIKSLTTRAGFRRRITTHSFRVSCATEMIKHKADIKYVQMQLGHVRIDSTEKYLRLVPNDLKKVHNRTHPRDRKKGVNTES